jgi:hypothetical protein
MLTRMYDHLPQSRMGSESVMERSELYEIGARSCYEHQVDLVRTKRLKDSWLAHAL